MNLKNALLNRLALIGLVPVVKIDNAADALPLARALSRGGLPCAEITLRTPAAPDAIQAIACECGEDFTVGAGTVLNAADAELAVERGAAFVVSPGFDEGVLEYAASRGIPAVPGVSDATGIMRAQAAGLDTVKFFPAEQSGGVAAIKALSAPFPAMYFMPTGGIGADNMNAYLALPQVACCGGSFMVPPALVREGRFDEIEALTRAAVDKLLGFSLCHIGINYPDSDSAMSDADRLSALFSFGQRELPGSCFVSEGFELLKHPGHGRMGHIAVGTHNPERAVFHLTRRGATFEEASAAYEADGRLRLMFLDGDIGGFAVHIVKV